MGDIHRPAVRVWQRWLLSLLTHRRDRDAVLAELDELWALGVSRHGERKATARYRREVRSLLSGLLAEWLRRAWRAATFRRIGGTFPSLATVLETALGDLRQSLRGLRRRWAFSGTVVLTVGLGLGGTTAVFAVVHGLLIEPLPYPDSDHLVRVYTELPGVGRIGMSAVDYLALAEQQRSFEGVAAYRTLTLTYANGEVAERVPARLVTPGYFGLLGLDPVLGRRLVEAEGVPGGPRSALVSNGFWRSRLGGDPGAVGRPVRLSGIEYTVVGVLPPAADPLTEGRQVFPALQMAPPTRKGPFNLVVLGRLRDGIDRTATAGELRSIEDRLFPLWESSWQNRDATWVMADLREVVVGDVATRLAVLLTAVAFLLLIAVANTANLLVARGLQRGPELAMRAALGASRRRILLHLSGESALLAAGGAALGLAIAWGGVQLAATVGVAFLPWTGSIRLSGPVFGFLLAATAVSLLLFGLVPAVQASRTRARSVSRRATMGRVGDRLRQGLVGAQFAVTVALLVGGALLLGSLTRLGRVDPGFDPEGLVAAQVALPEASYAEASDVAGFWSRVLPRVRAIPGVLAAGRTTDRPPEAWNTNNFQLEDRPTPPGATQHAVPWLIVDDGYFDVLGLSVVAGRVLGSRSDSARTAVVDERWAERFYPDLPVSAVVGRRYRSGGCTTCRWTTVVGVVSTVKYAGLDQPATGAVYESQAAFPTRSSELFLRTAGDPTSVLPAVRRIVRDADPGVPVSWVATGSEMLGDALRVPRYLTRLVGVFAAVALLISLVGVYGTMTRFVQARRREMGIRLAIGGAPSRVAQTVVGRGLAPVVVGVVFGLGIALGLTRFMAGLLFGVSAADPGVFAAAAAVALLAAAAAVAVPAGRALRIDPGESLRVE